MRERKRERKKERFGQREEIGMHSDKVRCADVQRNMDAEKR